MTQQVLNYSQSFGYNSVTLLNTNFLIISKTAWVPCLIVVMKQKQPLTLREKCPNTDQKQLRIWIPFTQCYFFLRCQFFAKKRQLNERCLSGSFFKRLYCRYQLLRAALHHMCICLRWVLGDVLSYVLLIALFCFLSLAFYLWLSVAWTCHYSEKTFKEEILNEKLHFLCSVR